MKADNFRKKWPGSDPGKAWDCPDCDGMGVNWNTPTPCPTCDGVTIVPHAKKVAFANKLGTGFKVVCVSMGQGMVSATVTGPLETTYVEDEWTFTDYPQFAFSDKQLAFDWMRTLPDSMYPYYQLWECDTLYMRPAPDAIPGLPKDILHRAAKDWWEKYLLDQPAECGCVAFTPEGSMICDRVRLRSMVDEVFYRDEEE